MQDRFKFRGYHPVIGKVMDISEIDFHERIAYFTDGDGFNIDEVKLMQCTGLRDRHNNLIYEGDIIKYYFLEDDEVKSEAYEIKYSNKQLAFILKTLDGKHEDNFITYGFNYEQGSHSVVGNIFENPLDTTKN